MKNISSCLGLLMCLFSVSCSPDAAYMRQAQRAANDQIIAVTVSSLQSQYVQGSSVPITVTVSNKADHRVTIPNGSAWVDNQFRFGLDLRVEGPDGEVLGPIFPPGVAVPLSLNAFTTLRPEESFLIEFDISAFVPQDWDGSDENKLFRQSGKYQVRGRLRSYPQSYLSYGASSEPIEGLDIWMGESLWSEIVITIK